MKQQTNGIPTTAPAATAARTPALALACALAVACGQPPAARDPSASPNLEGASGAETGNRAATAEGAETGTTVPTAAPCVPDLASTLVRFDSSERLQKLLRSVKGPLPQVTYGREAEARDGDENHRQALVLTLPETAGDDVYLQVFDADTGWSSRPDEKRPWDDQPAGKWDTVTRFRLLGAGGATLLEYRSAAGKDTPGDQSWVSWGPIPPACGAAEGSERTFVLEVDGIAGNDGNAFLAGLSTAADDHRPPPGSRATVAAPTLRLVEADRAAAELRFRLPPGSREISIRSFDLARGDLRLETALRSVAIRPSGQGDAVEVRQPVDGDEASRLAALIFAGGFDNPNDVTFTVVDQDGSPLPIELPGRRRQAVSRPPVARATSVVEADCRTVRFDASGSTDPDGDELFFDWDFGDGGGAREVTVSHTYAEPGTYRGRLLVADDSGAVRFADRRSFERTIWRRPRAEAGADRVGAPGVPVEFDGGASVDPDGGELRYRWRFGDGGGGRGERVSHRFARPGTYRVTLDVEDSGEAPCNDASDSLEVVINAPPVAEAGADRLDVAPGDDIAFDGGGSRDPEGQPLAYRWEFGDQAAADGPAARHRYTTPGTYRAVLTVTDPSGAPNASASDSIEVFVNAPPQAVVTVDRPVCASGSATACFESCELGVTVDGTGSADADGDRLSFAWDLGDGAMATASRARHVYADDGAYAARLTVDDGRGLGNSRQTARFDVRIHRPPRAAAGPAQRTVIATQPFLLSGASSVSAGTTALRYRWDFDPRAAAGDDAASAGDWAPTTVHVYEEPGSEHRVRLTVTDDSGLAGCRSGETEVLIRVQAPR